MKRRNILVIFVICISFVGIVVFWKEKALPIVLYRESLSVPTPTPFPFQELTIPHLRERTYESSLGVMRKNAETSSYTSYIVPYDSDGLSVNGLLMVPKGEMPGGGFPAVVFVHGYIPPSQYRTETNYTSYAAELAKKGLVVYKIDLRGHDQSEGEPGGAYYSSDYIIDTLHARAALAGTDFVNPDRIGLWGHSMAGNVVMCALAARPEIPAVVVWAGAGYTYADLSAYGIQDESWRPPEVISERQRKRQQLRDTYGNFEEGHWFWKQVAVTDYLSDIQGRVEIHHAVDDAVVTIQYSRNLAGLLEKAGVNYALFEYQSGGHNLTGSTFAIAVQRSADFYLTNL